MSLDPSALDDCCFQSSVPAPLSEAEVPWRAAHCTRHDRRHGVFARCCRLDPLRKLEAAEDEVAGEVAEAVVDETAGPCRTPGPCRGPDTSRVYYKRAVGAKIPWCEEEAPRREEHEAALSGTHFLV